MIIKKRKKKEDDDELDDDEEEEEEDVDPLDVNNDENEQQDEDREEGQNNGDNKGTRDKVRVDIDGEGLRKLKADHCHVDEPNTTDTLDILQSGIGQLGRLLGAGGAFGVGNGNGVGSGEAGKSAALALKNLIEIGSATNLNNQLQQQSNLNNNNLNSQQQKAPQRCPICKKTLQNVRRHINEVHVGLTYSCEICARPFKRTDKLNNHILKEHKLA